jgi:hypothetical protein
LTDDHRTIKIVLIPAYNIKIERTQNSDTSQESPEVILHVTLNPNFEEEELFQEIRQKSFSPKQMPWEPSKIKGFNEVLERNEYH